MPLTSTTFVAQTHNLWGDHVAEQRRAPLDAMYRHRQPDLLATQEQRPWSRDLIDDAMPEHSRVNDEFPGWATQSCLWWRRDLFEYVEHGADDVGILAPDARLFWVRLATADGPILFSVAHLTWSGHPKEQETGTNQRTPQAAAIARRLAELADGAACLFAVDINDIGPPNWEFGNNGFLDSFTALGRHSPVTHPVVPSGFEESVGTRLSPLASPRKAIDWIFLRGPVRARAAEVVEFFHRGVAPSDHYPVAATLTLTRD
ncbi:hypothetical protein [Ruania alba]|uniref:Metal-dependent hydrolase, endonuclease/exonuclease/phosphatase family n=1 Tax=Ruania alba TaxID=648782 RepID=A0A1H5HRB3_9MICO|nr:hypothetical protein [Ruania alba]SEE30445.1 Metal-dependent hydrolase, endonuclease/exonuclease/phosphatase family [Ruania alba]